MSFTIKAPKCVNDSASPSTAYQFVEQYCTIYHIKGFGEIYIAYIQAFVNCELFLNQTSQYKEIVRCPVSLWKSIVISVMCSKGLVNKCKSPIYNGLKDLFHNRQNSDSSKVVYTISFSGFRYSGTDPTRPLLCTTTEWNRCVAYIQYTLILIISWRYNAGGYTRDSPGQCYNSGCGVRITKTLTVI